MQFWGELNNFCALIPVQAQQQQLSMRTATCEWRKGGGVPPGAEVYSPGNLLAGISYNACYVWSMKLSLLLQTHEDWIFVQWGCLVVQPVLLSPKPERRNLQQEGHKAPWKRVGGWSCGLFIFSNWTQTCTQSKLDTNYSSVQKTLCPSSEKKHDYWHLPNPGIKWSDSLF